MYSDAYFSTNFESMIQWKQSKFMGSVVPGGSLQLGSLTRIVESYIQAISIFLGSKY